MSNQRMARAAWGDAIPDWVLVLASACDRLGAQRAAATKLGVAASTVNQVLKNVYRADLARMEQRVRGRFMAETVNCPAFEQDIRRDQCLRWQKAPLSAASPESVRLHRTCPTCPNNLKLKGGEA
jgi:DNA-binding transcriptional regulator YdaS (Cro superfamily)